jgi:hypothetical protein
MTSGLKLILQPCTNPEGGGGWGLELCLPDLTVCRTTWEADMGGKTVFAFCSASFDFRSSHYVPKYESGAPDLDLFLDFLSS